MTRTKRRLDDRSTAKLRDMQVVARPPVGGNRRYLLRAARPKLDWIRLMPWHGTRAEDTDGPSVVLVTHEGKEVVLQHPGILGQAKRAAQRFQEELEAVGEAEFVRRYGALSDMTLRGLRRRSRRKNRT